MTGPRRPLTRERAVTLLRDVHCARLSGVERMTAEHALAWLDDRLTAMERERRAADDTRDTQL